MAFFYMDTDTGDDGDNGTTWALAKLTLEGLLAVMSAGDTGFIQGAAADDSVSDRTFTSPGIPTNPCFIIGVVDGTTNTGTSVVVADLAVTLPIVSTTGGAPDMTWNGALEFINVHIITGDRTTYSQSCSLKITNGHYAIGDRALSSNDTSIILKNSIFEPTTTSGETRITGNSKFAMLGGSVLFTAAAQLLEVSSTGLNEYIGVDLSGLTAELSNVGAAYSAIVKIQNCEMPASFTAFTSQPTTERASTEIIASSDTSSVASTDSIQDYQYQDAYGTIDLEVTAVRTGGADDDATGAFSYAMTPHASATLESSGATLKSPWMSVWVDGGSNTLTVYIANDSASTDYNLDEAWVEFYTPSSADSAQYDQTFDAGDARLLDSSTAITDDTGSTWGTGANNHQKFSATVTTGYTGWAYARLHLAKRSATPDTLFLDPRIGLS